MSRENATDTGQDRWLPIRGINLHVKEWESRKGVEADRGRGVENARGADSEWGANEERTGEQKWRDDDESKGESRQPPFLLLHGLSSNLRTWEGVAEELTAHGHRVVAADQRGHGRSDKPPTGYGFDEVTADLRELIDALDFDRRPIVAGQSWGGSVVLDFAARYPGLAAGLVLVDGGFTEMASRPGATWEKISVELRPPPLAGTPLAALRERMRRGHPDWDEIGIERTLGNFEALPDGTIRPWLTLDRHMEILRSLWELRTSQLYARIAEPVLLCPAARGDSERIALKRGGVEVAAAAIPRARVRWFEDTDHDIHVHRPRELVSTVLEAIEDCFFDDI